MPNTTFDLLNILKTKAGTLTHNTPLYNWSLLSSTPDRLIVKPVDPWPGDADKAQALLSAAGVNEQSRNGPQWFAEWWNPEDADDIWIDHIHGFNWLRDLRTHGGARAREQGRLMIESWLDNHKYWNAEIWRPDLTARRLTMWICHYDYFGDGYDIGFEDKFLSSLVRQAKHLENSLNKTNGTTKFQTIKGLLYAGIALENHEHWLDIALKALTNVQKKQILPDGGHISRSPSMMLETLESLVDIRIALNAGAYPVPDDLTTTIEDLSAALRLFRYRDRKLGVFHMTQEGDIDYIDSILAQAGTHKKRRTSLPDTGFERIEQGRSLIVMDTGKAPAYPHDKTTHAAPLAFEFSYGKERIITNCGTHPTCPKWREALRFTGGHNTACLDHRNACEIKKDGHFGRKVTQTTAHRDTVKGAALIVASHNGYAPLNGITHTRKLYITDEGHDFRGADDLNCAFDLVNPVEIALRFHIHPNVTASLVQDDTEVLLRIPGGIGWRFKQSGAKIKLEDSLYLGTGNEPRKTKQIALHTIMKDANTTVKWSFKREG